MKLAEFRIRRGLSLEQCATQLGLKPTSKGHLSRLENGQLPFPIKLALQIEAWSAGEVRAVELLKDDDARLLGGAIDRAPAEAAA